MGRVGAVFAAALLLLGLGVITSWVWTSALMHRAVEEVTRDTRAVAITTEAELTLLSYHRMSNLALVSRSPEIEADRAALLETLEGQLAAHRDYAGDEEFDRLQREAVASVQRYVRERERIQASGLPVESVLDRMAPLLDDALNALHAVRLSRSSRALQTREHAARFDSVSDVVGGFVGFLFVGVLVTLVIGARRLVLAPVLQIRDAIERFRKGETSAVAPVLGTAEIAEIATTFNRMSETLLSQRRGRLAFLGGVAHDLRNPLSTIKMGIEILERNPAVKGDTRAADVLGRLGRQTDRLSAMLSDLTDASSMEAGRLELSMEAFDLVEMTKELVETYAPLSKAHRISFRPREDSVLIRADPHRIDQVLRNLLSNAIKYSPAGGEITVDLARVGDEVFVAVEDHGLGIPLCDVDSLFEPFQRHRRSARVAEGMGLGLSVVKRIVDAHQGRIEVTSVLEEGSTFRVWFPLRGPKEGLVADSTAG